MRQKDFAKVKLFSTVTPAAIKVFFIKFVYFVLMGVSKFTKNSKELTSKITVVEFSLEFVLENNAKNVFCKVLIIAKSEFSFLFFLFLR